MISWKLLLAAGKRSILALESEPTPLSASPWSAMASSPDQDGAPTLVPPT